MASPSATIRPARLSLAVALALGAATALYLALLPWHSADVDAWFVPWTQIIIAEGPIHALAEPMRVTVEGTNGHANYNPPYLYLLIVGSTAAGTLSPFGIIKLVSVAGALTCVACAYGLLRVFLSVEASLAGAAGLLLLPTLALNAAAWGQVDAYWSALALLAVTAALRGRFALMMAAFGAALAFKAQAVFLGPFILYVVLANRVRWRTWLVAVVAYAGMLLPAWIAGRPALDLATIYLEQAQAYHWLSMNAPNPWAFVQYFRLMSLEVGLVVGFILAATAALAIVSLAVRVRLEGEHLLLLALVSSAAMPFLLPKMLDRYFFLADVLSVILALVSRQRWAIAAAILIQIGSLGAYGAHMIGFLHGRFIGGIAMGVALMILVVQLRHATRAACPAQEQDEALLMNTV
jgi:Gpi18-like mannosyltransferase